MNVQIINKDFSLNIHGFSGVAINKNYAETAFQLMDKMWRVVKASGLQNKGINIWVYEPNESVFAGVELKDIPDQQTALEQMTINLTKYAYYKHVGPYDLLKQVGKDMREELRIKGFEPVNPYIEIYGHWNNDENKLETELLMCLR